MRGGIMKLINLSLLAIGLLLGTSCSPTSKAAQTLFTPDHYRPPEIYTKSRNGDELSLIIEDNDERYFKLNKDNTLVREFINREAMLDESFAQIAYLYLMAAESQCEKRVSDISRGRTATNSGFGALTMISAIAGSAIGTTSGANTASGLAAAFNGLSSNAAGVQSQITAQYSGNIATAIVKKQNSMIEGAENTASGGIKGKLDKLLSEAPNQQLAEQSAIHYELSKLNRACTVSSGQREIGERLN